MFANLHAVVVDQDQAERSQLAKMLEKLRPELRILSSTREEVNSRLLADYQPDLIFWSLESHCAPLPPFISSSTDQKSFDLVYTLHPDLKDQVLPEVSAHPCLLKPIDLFQLSAILDRSLARRERQAIMQKLDCMLRLIYLNSNVILELPKLRGAEFVRSEELIYCESDNNYTKIYLRNRNPVLISKPIRWLEEKLPDGLFVRIHKCYLINLCYLREYFKGDGGQVELQDGTVINVARNRKHVLLDAIRAFVR